MIVGLISDTHGLIRPEALRALAGVDLILHAGDVGQRRVLDELSSVAPVHAVSGNVDLPDGSLRPSYDCELEGVRVHVSHGHEIGQPTPERLVERYDADVIVYGHTHRALVTRITCTARSAVASAEAEAGVGAPRSGGAGVRGGAPTSWMLVINPGAAGPTRFDITPTVGRLELPERKAKIISL